MDPPVTPGPEIGRGRHRTVHDHPERPDLVLKVTLPGYHQATSSNWLEWSIWKHVSGTDLAQYFAPCESFSKGVLAMRRCEPCEDDTDDLTLLGVRIRDTGRARNCGMLDGRRVVIDYGHPDALALLNKLKGH